MSGLNDRLARNAVRNRNGASRETYGFRNDRKSDLREMLREAVENTKKLTDEEHED